MQYYGYVGKILRVDLSSGEIKKEPLDIELARKFLGGWGMNQWLAYQLVKPGEHQFSPGSPIIIGAGPLVGTLAPTCCKVAVTMKRSNPTNEEGNKFSVATSMGGTTTFGHMMKSAGYDHIVITGRSEKPVYLKVVDDDVEICDATDLWGKDIYESSDILVSRHSGKVAKAGVWVIGPAGENLVTLAQVIVDKENTMGRYGGAVLGSKKLKGVVVHGTKGIKAADPKKFRALVRDILDEMETHPPLKVFPQDMYHGGGAITPEYPLEAYYYTKGPRRGCAACIVGCHGTIEIRDGEFAGQKILRGIFGDVRDFGRRLKLQDYREAVELIHLLEKLGFDKYAGLKMLYLITRLYEREIITADDTGGLTLKLGDFNAYRELLMKIVHRQDIGNVIADGWYAVFKKYGMELFADKDAPPIIKGADTIQDARFINMTPVTFSQAVKPTLGRHTLTNSELPRGEDIYREEGYWPERKRTLKEIRSECEKMAMTKEEEESIFASAEFNVGRLAKFADDSQAVCDSLGSCSGAYPHLGWPMRIMSRLAAFYSAATGFPITDRELVKAGERVWNIERMINCREGFNRQDDAFPPQWVQMTEVPMKLKGTDVYLSYWSGKKVEKEDLDKMLDDYYDQRGWDIKTGNPTRRKLEELGLKDIANASSCII